MAFGLAVYASPRGFPRHDARLASGRWSGATGRASHPQGPCERFQNASLHLVLLSQALLGAITSTGGRKQICGTCRGPPSMRSPQPTSEQDDCGTSQTTSSRSQASPSPDICVSRLIPTLVLPLNPDTLFAAPSCLLVWPGQSTRNPSAMGILVEHTFSEERSCHIPFPCPCVSSLSNGRIRGKVPAGS